MKKVQVIRTDTERVVIPAASRERFLVQSSPNIHCMDDYKISLAGISHLTTGYLAERDPSPLHLILYTRSGTASVETTGITR